MNTTTTRKIKRPQTSLPTEVVSHWNVTIEGLKLNTTESYVELESKFVELDLPDIRIGQVKFKEGDAIGAKRTYIRVAYRDLTYDICVCPFGTATFVSSWLGEKSDSFLFDTLSKIPIVGYFLKRKKTIRTFYQYDSLQSFMERVHSTLLEWLDEATTNKGLKPINNSLRKPVMKNLLDGFPGDTTDWGDRWDHEEKN